MGAVLPGQTRSSGQLHVSIIEQRRGLQRVSRSLATHVSVCQPMQLRLNQRDQFFQSLFVSVSPIAEELRHLLLGRCGRNHKPPLLIHALPSSGCKRLQKIFLFSGVFRLPFRPLAGETTTSTKGTTMNPLTQFKKNHMKAITKLIYLAFTVVILAIGAVTANGAPNDLFVSINGNTQNGGGFIYEYNPGGVQSIFAAGLSRPR